MDTTKRRPGQPRREVPAKMRSIYLTETEVDIAKRLGDGKISVGVRVALLHCAAAKTAPAEPQHDPST